MCGCSLRDTTHHEGDVSSIGVRTVLVMLGSLCGWWWLRVADLVHERRKEIPTSMSPCRHRKYVSYARTKVAQRFNSLREYDGLVAGICFQILFDFVDNRIDFRTG